jgi:hypothetical protein
VWSPYLRHARQLPPKLHVSEPAHPTWFCWIRLFVLLDCEHMLLCGGQFIIARPIWIFLLTIPVHVFIAFTAIDCTLLYY